VQGGLTHALPHLRSGALKLVLPGLHDPGAREVVVHYPHRRYLAPRVRVVVDALMAHFAASADMHVSVDGVLRDLVSPQ
jgi:DNA-binding transcriptional LysR family regulator